MKTMILGKLLTLFDSYSEQRFLVTLLCWASLTVLCWFEKIDGGSFFMGLSATAAAFIAGSTIEKIQSMRVSQNGQEVAFGDAATAPEVPAGPVFGESAFGFGRRSIAGARFRDRDPDDQA